MLVVRCDGICKECIKIFFEGVKDNGDCAVHSQLEEKSRKGF